MAKAIIEDCAKVSKVLWQMGDGEDAIGEPALLIEKYMDALYIQQEDRNIILNYETLPELAKLFNKLYREFSTGNLFT